MRSLETSFEAGRRDPNCREPSKGDEIRDLVVVLSVSGPYQQL